MESRGNPIYKEHLQRWRTSFRLGRLIQEQTHGVKDCYERTVVLKWPAAVVLDKLITDNLFKLCTPTIVNDCLPCKTPQKFHNYYKEHESVYDLRNLGLAVQKSGTRQGSLSLSILVINMWNGLSHTLKEHRHTMCFRTILVESHIANYRNWMMTTVYLNMF